MFVFFHLHPDEIFQSQEVAARTLFDFGTFIPWEYSGNKMGQKK